MDIRKSFKNQINRCLVEEEESAYQDVELQNTLFKLVKEKGVNNVMAELINILKKEEPEIAEILQGAMGPLPED